MRLPSTVVLKYCALALVLVLAPGAAAQIRGTVTNARGAPIAGAAVSDMAGHTLAVSGRDGEFSLARPPERIEVAASHYVAVVVTIVPGQPLLVILRQPLETVTVTAYRSALGAEDSPASTRAMSRQQLEQAAPPSLDGKLLGIPGFQLYRRSSSLVANPTTEGISLRGLGSTAASRSLVVMDDVPLNDPYGGWIHWEELPEPAVQSVEIVRGGASDLYGSSAIGGVINVIPVEPTATGLEAEASGGSESMLDDGVLGTFRRGAWSGLGSAGLIATDGYILTAPYQRGPIDQPSNVHAQNGLVELEHALPQEGRIFLRSNALNESRHNGTPDQWNVTRLWRYAGGADWRDWSLRLYGSDEHFRQTFSSIAVGRASEALTRYVFDPATELGAALRWHRAVEKNALLLAGADTHDVKAADDEQLFLGAGGTLSTAAEQRQTGAWGEVLLTPAKWTLSGSTRVDHFSNINARQYSSGAAAAPLPSWSETVFDPRLGVVRRITPSLAVSASGFRAYRAPTENELYRAGQVGQQVTEPNPNLRSERATGWETGLQADLRRYGSSVRASYFWTQVNRPITALTLSVTPTSEILRRENLGQIESRGVSLDYAMRPVEWLAVEGGYQYADATVTNFAPQASLVGKWIPEVARNMATTQIEFERPRVGTLSLQGQMSGRMWDDSGNTLLLHGFFRMDAYAAHNFGRHVTGFASGENLFDRSIEVGKTPLTTLGTPRLVRVGIRVNWGE